MSPTLLTHRSMNKHQAEMEVILNIPPYCVPTAKLVLYNLSSLLQTQSTS